MLLFQKPEAQKFPRVNISGKFEFFTFNFSYARRFFPPYRMLVKRNIRTDKTNGNYQISNAIYMNKVNLKL